ncbi:4-hydroxy-tetrahydrodipicolinate reductase [Oenococcus oeni]|uniref:4-hydroxy-tetrahydrodipicolinate reductase n=1 Tax=Oenococcus oeni TaxID=1247 RepID=UPI00050F33E2|nr:4-hydroxy-tetrahydrodipicolinate reductase [Oenococcus oeni]KGO16671.1 dihydrodipicolinate reductase [Oenococcus oeni X2L]KGH80957.1 dihydrodipicolinate reductase [Oenococcus oeni IOEB_0607]KGH89547.1 dihydrodipicolinate reductase [Oenococcus oeni IOEB_L26_1]KMQ37688.1 dihydrodipicolinate reductase [Oenococcus oeni]OIK61592.1 4-hydroxy-tetrahydrodipicolinate reductase [Oenococcus oeni]
MKSILLAGAFGKMGRGIQKLIAEHEDWSLDAILVHEHFPENYSGRAKIFRQLSEINQHYDLWIDVTKPDSVFENAVWAIEHNTSLIIGTSGLKNDQITKLKSLADKNSVSGIIAPNFSISAVLMMYFSGIAARFMPNVSIEEIHHPDKLDAPSGTARITAGILADNGASTKTVSTSADGDKNIIEKVLITSKRKKDYVAYQSVNFVNEYETLSISQNSLDRKSFMPGVELAIKKANQQQGLVVGLDKIMGLK